MKRIAKIPALVAVVLLAAVGVTGALAGPGGLLTGAAGADSPPPAAESAATASTADQDRSGAALHAEDEASDEDADGVEIKGDPIDCPSGEDTQFKFEQEGDEFEVTGLLVSLDATAVTVTGPQGDVVAALDPAAEIKGPPAVGEPVKVEGSVLADGSFVAREIEPACEAGDQGDVDDDHADTDDVDDGDQGDNSGPGSFDEGEDGDDQGDDGDDDDQGEDENDDGGHQGDEDN